MRHRRFWVSTLSIVVAFMICAITACAPSDNSSRGLEFQYNGVDGYIVTGLGIFTDNDLIIPSEHNGLPVKTIGKEAFSGSYIFSLELPDSVTTIDDFAFSGCYYLGALKLSSSIKTIGNGAFNGCKTLKTLDIPTGVNAVGRDAFKFCVSLESVIIGDGLTRIVDSMFLGCYKLSSVSIPDSVTSIGDQAFEDCRQLESILIPGSVAVIGWGAFFYCENLKEIIFSGTQEQWNAIEKGEFWDGNGIDYNGIVYHHSYTLRFTDGEIYIP